MTMTNGLNFGVRFPVWLRSERWMKLVFDHILMGMVEVGRPAIKVGMAEVVPKS
jgi:hypothetical protein